MRLTATLPLIYAVVGLTFAALLIFTTPPFQVADEPMHLHRADSFTHGLSAFSVQQDNGRPYVAGRVHTRLIEAYGPFGRVQARAQEKVHASDYALVNQPLDVRRTQVAMGLGLNPVFYVPSGAAVAIGRHWGLTVQDTLWLARAFNAVVSVGVGALALTLAGQARLPMFTLLLLPMTVSLGAGVTQDGPLIATAALGAALISRAMAQDRPMRPVEVLGCALAIAFLGMAKQPYALFALLLLIVPAQSRTLKFAAALAAFLAPAAWNVALSATGWAAPLPLGSPPDAEAQVRYLFSHLGQVVPIALETFRIYGSHYCQQFVAILGWLDTALPETYYPWAYAMVGVSLLAGIGYGLSGEWRAVRWVTPLIALLGAAGVCAAMYLIWTPVGAPRVEGVQGRYFLPLAMFLPLAFEGPRPLLAGDRLRGGLGAAVTAGLIVFPLISLVLTELALIQRYYLS